MCHIYGPLWCVRFIVVADHRVIWTVNLKALIKRSKADGPWQFLSLFHHKFLTFPLLHMMCVAQWASCMTHQQQFSYSQHPSNNSSKSKWLTCLSYPWMQPIGRKQQQAHWGFIITANNNNQSDQINNNNNNFCPDLPRQIIPQLWSPTSTRAP